MSFLDNLYWVVADRCPISYLEKRLTLVGNVPYAGARPCLKLYEKQVLGGREYLGIPRQFGKNLFGEYEDRTFYPKVTWPGFEGKYRDGQERAVENICKYLREKQGTLFKAKPGSGKTLIATAVAAAMQTSVLVVVHKVDLAEQWADTLRKFFPGAQRGHIQQSCWDYMDRHCVTALGQTLFRAKLDEKFWRNFGLVIFDEVHRFPAQTFWEVMKRPMSRYLLGVSATYRRKDGLHPALYYHIGDIDASLRDTAPVGKFVSVLWRTSICDEFFKRGNKILHSRYISCVAKNAPYNKWLAEQAKTGAAAGRRVLVIGDRTEQLLDIRRRLVGKPFTVGLYVGAVNGKRTSKEALFAAKSCNIVLATYGMMQEGSDAPELDTLIFATPRTDIEQVLGRIQREREGKKELLVVDPVFDTGYMRALARKRRVWYNRLGFKEYEK